jgi:tetratricopeptide (TPR) repeat protein
MKFTTTAISAALASAAFAAAPASAQEYGGQQQQPRQPDLQQYEERQQPAAQGQGAQDTTAVKAQSHSVSRGASKAVKALQEAVAANNTAAIPAALAAAQAVAQTGEDRYVIALLHLQAAAAAKDNAGVASAIESMLASGVVTQAEKFPLYLNLGKAYAAVKQNDRAAQAYQQALQLDPNSIDATAGLAELRVAQGQPAEAIALLQKGIALQSAGGGRPSETWFKRALQVAFKAKLPQAVQISQDWVRAYPTSANWTNALAIYQNVRQLDESTTLDLLRLKRATGALTPSDYFNYADIAVRSGFAGESKSVLEEGFSASSEVKRSDPSFSQLYSLATERTKGDRASLPAAPPADATARQILNTGDAYFGYGDYAKAVEFYRAALAKGGADADRINLHIGMALARQGDKAGAAAALKAVGGPQAEIAKYWLIHIGA